jgi:cell division protease FtsH
VSDATAQVIDAEVRRLIEEGESKARLILNEKIDDLHTIANALLEYETLSGDEVAALLRGETISRADDDTPPAPKVAVSTGRSSVPTTKDIDPPLNPAPAH